jgi:uncharacterized protein DUF6221
VDDLLPWLRARIAAEQARAGEDLLFAENAAGGTWMAHEGGPLNASYLHVNGAEAAMFHGWNHRKNVQLAARFNPDVVAERANAVLAQCEAHTAILDRYEHVVRWIPASAAVAVLRDVVLMVGLAYQRQPGYREEWRETWAISSANPRGAVDAATYNAGPATGAVSAAHEIVRMTHDGQRVTAPSGTTKCAQTTGRPHPSDWTHRLFAANDPGPMVQLMTGCGRRAHRFVLESEGKDVDCPRCLGKATP